MVGFLGESHGFRIGNTTALNVSKIYLYHAVSQDNMASNFDTAIPSTVFWFLFCPFHVFLNFIHIKIPRDPKLTVLTFFSGNAVLPRNSFKTHCALHFTRTAAYQKGRPANTHLNTQLVC